MKGPVANAGSIFILLKNKGIQVPKTAANMITDINEILMAKLYSKDFPINILTTNSKTPHSNPFTIPTPNSLNNLLKIEPDKDWLAIP